MAANCPHCGGVLIPGQPLCTECGKPARDLAPARGPASGAAKSGDAAPQSPRRDKQKDFALVGRTVANKYKVLDVLGQGGFGTVYLVEITAGMVGERVAMKVLPEELSSKPAFRNQFLNEIRVAMRVVDRYIAQIRDVGTTDDGLLYYTMDLCAGVTLAQIIRDEGSLPITRTLLIVLNVLRGLQTAHAAGIIHRDLKPANIMVQNQGGKDTVRILDFGIATAIQTGERQKGLAGSPHYMPPEQFMGETIGFYTDLYAIGVILYECVTGQRPYPGNTAQEVFKSLKSRAPAPLHALVPEASVFPGLSELVMKAVERNPERRFQSARELFDAVNAVLTHATSQAGSSQPAASPAPAKAPAAAQAGAALPAGPPPAARVAAERIRRRRPSAMARRPGSRAGAVAAATFIIASTVLGVLFHKEISRAWNERGRDPAGPAPTRTIVTEKAQGVDRTSKSTEPVPPKKGPAQPGGKTLEEQKTAALASMSARTSNLLEEGKKALDAKEWTVAVERADTVLSLDPQNADAHRLRGLAALKLDDYRSAEASLERARVAAREKGAAEPDPTLISALAETKMNLSPPALGEAETLVRETLRASPTDASLITLLARVLEAQGKRAEAKILLEAAKVQKIESPSIDEMLRRYSAEETGKTRDAARKLAHEAREAFERGRFADAAELAVKSSELAPNVTVDLLAADSLVELGKLDASKEIVVGGLAVAAGGKSEANTARFEIRLDYISGSLILAEHESNPAGASLAEAEAAFKRAGEALGKAVAKEDARFKPLALLGLARTYALRGDLGSVKDALQWLEREQSPMTLAEGARIFTVIARRVESKEAKVQAFGLARRTLQALLRLKDVPDAVRQEGSYLLGTAQLALGDLELSEAAYKDAVKSFAEAEKAGLRTEQLYEMWAEAYDRTGNLIRAAQLFRNAYELAPSPSTCLRAIEYYLSANPTSPEARSLLAEGKERFRDSKEIQKKYQEVFK